jgi:hypothetical protein
MLFVRCTFLLNFLVLFTTTTASSIQEQIELLSNENQLKIFNLLQPILTKRDASIDKHENWCCKIDPGVQATSKTRQITFYV